MARQRRSARPVRRTSEPRKSRASKARTAKGRTAKAGARRRRPGVKTRRQDRPIDLGLPAGTQRGAIEEISVYHATSPKLSGGDVDADWQRAESSGEEAVGGTVGTPDQSVVDEIGEAVGLSQEPAAELRSSAEILAQRDARRRPAGARSMRGRRMGREEAPRPQRGAAVARGTSAVGISNRPLSEERGRQAELPVRGTRKVHDTPLPPLPRRRRGRWS
ncbi:MAG TPA: DUF6335 family protein [Methylomirabilota bacterium]|jgi:hypothetical protein|nr:DUF6335 family protein [Methylomirabilota bacterium]